MSNRFTVDFVNKKIIGTKTSLNKAKHYGTPEYNELCELMEAHPRFRVVTKKVKKSTGKHTYTSTMNLLKTTFQFNQGLKQSKKSMRTLKGLLFITILVHIRIRKVGFSKNLVQRIDLLT